MSTARAGGASPRHTAARAWNARVRTDDDGYFYYLGRAGAMIKTAGANVAPPEVERAISAVTGAPAYVLGLPEMTRGEIVAAVVVADDPAACPRAVWLTLRAAARAASRRWGERAGQPARAFFFGRLPLGHPGNM